MQLSEVFFKHQINYFSDALISEIHLMIIKIRDLWGDLRNISPKTATLVQLCPMLQASGHVVVETSDTYYDCYSKKVIYRVKVSQN